MFDYIDQLAGTFSEPNVSNLMIFMNYFQGWLDTCSYVVFSSSSLIFLDMINVAIYCVQL